MTKKNFLFSHNFLTIVAMVLGVLSGLLDSPSIDSIAQTTADLTVRLMKLVAVPLLFLSVISSASHFKNLDQIKFLGKKIVTYTFFTTILAALVAEALYLVLSPILLGADIANVPSSTSAGAGFMDALLNMVPDNLVQAFLDNNILAVVIIAIILAVSILTIKDDERKVVFSFFNGLLNAIMRAVHVGLKLIPISVWAFVTILANQFSRDSGSLNAIGGLTLTVITANLLQGLVVLPLLLWWKKISPIKLFRAVKEALMFAFFTRSSTAALPVTLDKTIKNAHVREDVARLTIPLCATINMNGCAQFILLSVYFVSAYTGNGLMWWEHIGMIFLSVVAAVGNAGVPMGCFFIASSILASKNIPLHIMGSILPLYAFIDMVETALNVWSDVSIAKIVDKESAGLLDQDPPLVT